MPPIRLARVHPVPPGAQHGPWRTTRGWQPPSGPQQWLGKSPPHSQAADRAPQRLGCFSLNLRASAGNLYPAAAAEIEHAAQEHHRGGGHSTQCSGNQLPPFSLNAPGWVLSPGTEGTCSPPTRIVPRGLALRRTDRADSGKKVTAVTLRPVARQRKGCPTAAAGRKVSELGGKTSQSIWRCGWSSRAERVPSAGAAAPGVLCSRVALLLPSPPAPSQHPCQHLRAGFSVCHRSVTGCREL